MLDRNILDFVKKTGMPTGLISEAYQKGLSEKAQKKFDTTMALLATGKKNVFLVGTDCPAKELFCAKLFVSMMSVNKKTGVWMSPAMMATLDFSNQPRGAGVVVILGLDLLTAVQKNNIAQLIRTWSGEGRYFIIYSADELTVKEALGVSCHSYLLNDTILVELKEDEVKLPKV